MPPKKKKDPNAPKRALSSFMFYSNAVRDTVRKAQPNIPFSEVAKVIGQQWRGLTTEDKKPYDDMATADKARYAQEKKNYTPDDPTTKRLNRKKKDPNAPAKGLSAYLYFCMDHRKKTQDKNPAMSLKEVASLLADQWNDATDKERKKYLGSAEEDEARYDVEKAVYDKANGAKEPASADSTAA